MTLSDNTTTDEHHPPSYSRLFWLSLVLVLPALIYGLNLNFPAVAMSLLDLNIDTASWMGSIGIYAGPIGSILSGILIDKFGRKTALIFGIAPSLVGWALLYWNYSDFILLLGQTINGLSIGSLLYPIHAYAGECILNQNVLLRNNFMICVGFFATLGSSIVIFFSTFLGYSQICAVSVVTIAIIMVAFCAVIPESPAWLYLQGRIGDAEWSEKKLGISQPILHEKETHLEGKLQPAADNKWSFQSITQSLKKLKRPDVYKPFCIGLVGNALIPACGAMTVLMYMMNIIDDNIPGQPAKIVVNSTITSSSQSVISTQQLSLFCSLFAIVGCLLSTFVLSKVGIRKLLIAVHVVTGFCLGILTYCTFDGAVGVLQLRIASIAMLSFSGGCFIGPWTTASADMFPVDCKGMSGISNSIGSISGATANKAFPYLYWNFGGYTYCVYGFILILGTVYIYFFYPEVVGKTLDQIKEDFCGKKADKKDNEEGIK